MGTCRLRRGCPANRRTVKPDERPGATAYLAAGTGPSRTPNTLPSGSLNQAARAGPIWAMKSIVLGVSYSCFSDPDLRRYIEQLHRIQDSLASASEGTG